MKSVMKELLVNTAARNADTVATLTARTMNAGIPWSSEE